MKIGITCIVKGDTNVFSNGLLQNILTMKKLFDKSEMVDKCYLINTYTPKPDEFKGTYWEKHNDFILINEIEQCDVIIVTGGFIGRENTDYLRSKGKKVIQHVLSASLSLFTEKVIFSETKAGVYDAITYDAVWISPQFYQRDRFFVEAEHRCPVYEAPYVWDPFFMEEDGKRLGSDLLYAPNPNPAKRISIVEPNINMVKTCIVPLTIAEMVERSNPNLIRSIQTFGSQKISQNKDFIDFAGNLDITKAKKTRFVGRYALSFILQSYTDIMLSHQNQCELNYAYFDAAWFGYPVVHNSPMLKDLGFYYEENNAAQAAAHIKDIVSIFDSQYIDYIKRSRNLISRYLIEGNVKEYERLVNLVLNK